MNLIKKAASMGYSIHSDEVHPDNRDPSMLAQRPQMGWNSWNVLGCDLLNEENIKKQTDALISNGLDKLGFKYILIDDCWQDMERDAEQHLKADVEKFPNGMKALADYVH